MSAAPRPPAPARRSWLAACAARAARLPIGVLVSLALTVIVTVVLGSFALYSYQLERAERWQQLREDVAGSADELAMALGQPTWNFDEAQIYTIMKGAMGSRDLLACVLQPNAGAPAYIVSRNAAGQLGENGSVPVHSALLVERRPVRAGGQLIGSVTVYASPQVLSERLHQRLLTMGGMIALLVTTLVASLYLLLRHLVFQPLGAIGRYAANVQVGAAPPAPPPRARFFGELRGLNGAIRDMVTLLDSRYLAMRVSEERLQIATSAAALGIWDWDIAADAVVWDEQMHRLYGIAAATPPRPFPLGLEQVHPDDRLPVRALLAQALAGDGDFDAEYRIVWPDGAVHYVKGDGLIFRDGEGRPVRMVGVNYDISGHKRAELELWRHHVHLEELVAARTEALSVAVRQAQAANQAKSTFLANMSHELRTPLNAVIGFSRLMADSPNMQPDEKHNLALIHRAGRHLLTLINDILELSRIEAGHAVLQPEAVLLPELLQEVMDMVSLRGAPGALTLRLDAPDLPAAVTVDGTKLRQVLLNLMSNAVKFTVRGWVTLEVRVVDADGASRLAFAVSDNGPGIAAADQQRIFEPFIQAGERGDGSGLGLTISRDFVALMGGTLTLASAPGAGARFAFSLALQPASGLTLPAPASRGAAGAPAVAAGAPAPLAAADLAVLPAELRAALREAVQELNLARVAALLAPLEPALAEVVAGIERMLAQHQYPQLCAWLAGPDEAGI